MKINLPNVALFIHHSTGWVSVGWPNLLYWRSTKALISTIGFAWLVILIASRAISTQMFHPKAW